MDYKINVARNGFHLFEAASREATEAQAVQVWEELCQKYPAGEHDVRLERWESRGETVRHRPWHVNTPPATPAPLRPQWYDTEPEVEGAYLVIDHRNTFHVAQFWAHSRRHGAAHWRLPDMSDRVRVVLWTHLPVKPL
jgi:hypothetical protein